MTITKKGNLIPKVSFGFEGALINVVLTLQPIISKTEDLISLSVILLMCPFLTCWDHICNGFDLFKNYPIEYRIERKPDWYVFLNIVFLLF